MTNLSSYVRRAMLNVLLCTVCSGALAAEPVLLRVLSYNIHHGEGVDGKLDLRRIAQVINDVKPDLVALQEVDQNVRRTQVVDQPSELARLTRMHAVFGANIELQGGHYGNAVLSRFPITSWKNHLLPNFDAGEQRGVLMTDVSLPGGTQSLILLATHFDHRANDRERMASTLKISELCEQFVSTPMLLAGDLNDTPESRTLEALQPTWSLTSDSAQPTIPVARPARQIDFILYRPGKRWKILETRVLAEAIASDHRPILAVLELLPGED